MVELAGGPATERVELVGAGPVEADTDSKGGSLTALTVLVLTKETGLPIEGAEVDAFEIPRWSSMRGRETQASEGGAGETLLTDADGRVLFHLKPGFEHQLFVSADNLQAKHHEETLSEFKEQEQRELEVALITLPDLHFIGRIQSEQFQPVANAQVTLTSGPEPIVGIDGLFELNLGSWLGASGRANAPGYADVFFPIGSGHEHPEDARPITLKRSATLVVTVTGAEASPVRVRCTTDAYQLVDSKGLFDFPFPKDPVWTADSRADGSCELAGLPPDVPLTLMAIQGKRSKVLPETILLAPGERRELSVGLTAGAVLRGVAMDAQGVPARDEKIWLVSEQEADGGFYSHTQPAAVTHSDTNGEFEFTAVDPGKWFVGTPPQRDNQDPPDAGLLASTPVSVEVLPEDLVREVSLIVHYGVYIEGIVLDPLGEPMTESVYLHGWQAETGANLSTKSTDSGTFSLGPLAPGTCELRTNVFFTGYQAAEPVQAEPGESGVVVKLRFGASLSGSVLDGASGKPTQADIVLSWPRSEDGWSPFVMTSTHDGTFEFQGRGANSYAIFATDGSGKAGFTRLRVEDQVDLEDIVVSLEPAATLHIFYAGNDKYGQFEVWLDDIVVGADGLRTGTKRELTVPPGRIRVTLSSSGDEEERTVDLEAGETANLEFNSN